MSWLGITGFPVSFSVLDHYSNYDFFIGKVKNKFRMIFWYLVMWGLWLARNAIMFKGEILNEK